MKTARLATAVFLAWAAVFAQDAAAQETQQLDTNESLVEDAPREEVVDPADDGLDPAQQGEGSPAEGEAEAEEIEGGPPAESVLEGTAEPAEPEATYVIPDLPIIGAPQPGGVNYQPASTSIAVDTFWLSHWVHLIMIAIVLFVVLLLGIVIFKFNAKANPTPARFTHNTKIEIAWTLGPVLVLILIGSFSLPILFKQLEIPDPDLTVKATGAQWYWSYEYPDNEFSFDSLMLLPEELPEHGYDENLFRLATDTAMVVPVGAVVRIQTTGADVIHGWNIPAFGVKLDAIPGRLNEAWFTVDKPGVYFGQCSELCGKDHAFMPITVKALPQEEYDRWLDWAIEEYGGTRGENVAQAE